MSETAHVQFRLHAEAAPGLLPRLLQPFAKRDLTPDGFESRRDGDLMRAEITLLAIPADMVALVAGNLRQIVGVVELWVERPEAGQLRMAA